MRQYWDERAQENAAWYVDTSLSYDQPDMEQFWATGRQIVDEALVQAPVAPAQKALAVDIGCGLGRICLALADHFDRVVGFDISESMVAQAGELLQNPRIELHVGDGVSLRPLEDDTADFVTTFTVLQHQSSEALVLGYLRDAARVLRPGGVLAAQWNGINPIRYKLSGLRLRARRAIRRSADTRAAPEFMGTAVPAATVRKTLEAAGMEVVGFKGQGTLFSWVWAKKR
jgi:ubiquinone/menaquinone biosynthesis C-methylase UbiE